MLKPRDQRRLAYAVAMALFPAATLFTRWHFQAEAAGPEAAAAAALPHPSGAWLSPGQALVALLSTALFAVGMEYYARYAHEHWWHGDVLWFVHRTHHEPRTGILEDNDIFGVLNAAVVMPVLMQAYFAEPSYGAALRLGASMGISVFGCAYIAVHDGVHHERFWSRPLQRVAWFRAISQAHAAHHKKDHAAPYGLFLGPQELAAINAGKRAPGMPAVMYLGLGLWGLGVAATVCGSAVDLMQAAA